MKIPRTAHAFKSPLFGRLALSMITYINMVYVLIDIIKTILIV